MVLKDYANTLSLPVSLTLPFKSVTVMVVARVWGLCECHASHLGLTRRNWNWLYLSSISFLLAPSNWHGLTGALQIRQGFEKQADGSTEGVGNLKNRKKVIWCNGSHLQMSGQVFHSAVRYPLVSRESPIPPPWPPGGPKSTAMQLCFMFLQFL